MLSQKRSPDSSGTSQARTHANRLNALKSTGAKTQKGKAIVSQNALKHGLSARHDVVITENQEDFDLHRDSLLEELAPQTPMESMLTDRIISLSWRLKRADRIQNQTFDAMDEENKSNPFPNLTKALARNDPYRPNPQHDLTLGRIALKDFANARVLDRLLMYERRIENSLHKTILELQRLILIRNLAPSDHIELNSPRLARGPVPRVPTDKNKTTAPKTTYDIPHTTYEFTKQTQSQIPEINPTCYPTKTYPNIPLRSAPKNKPNQTQYSSAYEAVAAKPLAKLVPRRAGTKYDIRIFKSNIERSPDSSGMPHRDTTSEIRPQFHRSAHNKVLAVAAGMPHNACHTVENDHEL